MEERLRKIESYGDAHRRLAEALQRFPEEMWQFQPPEGWSIHQIVIHIADSEANSYVRCRRLAAEPGSAVLGYDENLWAERLGYHRQGVADALELFRLLRQASYRLLRALPEAAWSNTIHHSEKGLMTFDDWLDEYERHIPEHIAQMEKCYEAWQAAG